MGLHEYFSSCGPNNKRWAPLPQGKTGPLPKSHHSDDLDPENGGEPCRRISLDPLQMLPTRVTGAPR